MTQHVNVAIVGTGFSGLGAAIRMKQEGRTDFVLFERASDVGGVWRDNTYPGCACDVESHLYCFSFFPNPSWSHAYSGQREIWDYLRRATDHFELRPFIRFGHDVREAAWDAHAQKWRLETSHGAFTANVLVSAVGALSEPKTPQLPGIERFLGRIFHSARWDHDYDLTNKRVGVLGTGASAIQFIPKIQPEVSELVVFQRTPPWILPRNDVAFDAAARERHEASGLARAVTRSAIYLKRELLGTVFFEPRLAALGERLAVRHLESVVADRGLRAKLTPSYRMGCKRILVSDDYYPAVGQPNVVVETAPIVAVRERDVVTEGGAVHALDALILGTGFDVTEMPFARRVRGRDGRTLAETWDGSMRAHLGTTVAGFPSLFVIPGPNTGLGHSSVLLMIEAQIEHLLGALAHLDAAGAASVEPRQDAQQRFVDEVEQKMQSTVWLTGCRSWYLDRHGRNSTLWPGHTFSFIARVRRFRREEYVTEARRNTRVSLPPQARFEAALGRALTSLPKGLLARRPIVRGGLTLEPELAPLLAARKVLSAPEMNELPPVASRTRFRRDTAIAAGSPAATWPVATVRDLELAPGLRARHYAPERGDGAPLVVFYHGGGFVLGDLETHDAPCRILCREARAHVLAVDYRLAPEHRHPAAVEDAVLAFEWGCANARTLGADPTRVAVAGDSAGGNLAAVVSQEMRRRGRPGPRAQLLLYPTTDRTKRTPSVELYGDGFLLTSRDLDYFSAQYLGDKLGVRDPRVDPGLERDLRDLAPAIVATAGFDPLRDEAEDYAARLEAAGVPTTRRRFDGLVHGFANLVGMSPACHAALVSLGADLRAALA